MQEHLYKARDSFIDVQERKNAYMIENTIRACKHNSDFFFDIGINLNVLCICRHRTSRIYLTFPIRNISNDEVKKICSEKCKFYNSSNWV